MWWWLAQLSLSASICICSNLRGCEKWWARARGFSSSFNFILFLHHMRVDFNSSSSEHCIELVLARETIKIKNNIFIINFMLWFYCFVPVLYFFIYFFWCSAGKLNNELLWYNFPFLSKTHLKPLDITHICFALLNCSIIFWSCESTLKNKFNSNWFGHFFIIYC